MAALFIKREMEYGCVLAASFIICSRQEVGRHDGQAGHIQS